MKIVEYKGKIWRVLIPKDLKFDTNCIRNVLIERRGRYIITNLKDLKVIKAKFKDLLNF